MKPPERDILAAKLVEGVPEGLRARFALKKKYALSRRLVFKTAGGGEECWEVCEHLVNTIEANSLNVDSSVEVEPDRQLKRQHHWNAAGALKKMAKEGDQLQCRGTRTV